MKIKRDIQDINIKRIIGYIGSKVNLYPFLFETIIKDKKNNQKKLFIDLFGGTGAVSKMINTTTDLDIVINDLAIYTSYLGAELELNNISNSKKEDFLISLKNKLIEIDNLPLIENGTFFNEFSMGGTPKSITDKSVFNVTKNIKDENGKIIKKESNNYQEYQESRMFFKKEVGQKIDTFREYLKTFPNKSIEDKTIKDVLFLFLLSFANKNANTTSVYGAYLKHDKIKKTDFSIFDNSLYDYIEQKINENNVNNVYVCNDYAEKTLLDLYNRGLIESRENNNKSSKTTSNYSLNDTIIYWDPPYSQRSYESNYHILEYLCDLDFDYTYIKPNSKSAMKVNENKYDNPFHSKVKTPLIFKQLISESLKHSNLMYISYSNEGLMKEEDIKSIVSNLNYNQFLGSREEIKLTTFKQEYKRFTSGENEGVNTDKKNTVFEIIWKIEIVKK